MRFFACEHYNLVSSFFPSVPFFLVFPFILFRPFFPLFGRGRGGRSMNHLFHLQPFLRMPFLTNLSNEHSSEMYICIKTLAPSHNLRYPSILLINIPMHPSIFLAHLLACSLSSHCAHDVNVTTTAILRKKGHNVVEQPISSS